jgi:hypothetical protein
MSPAIATTGFGLNAVLPVELAIAIVTFALLFAGVGVGAVDDELYELPPQLMSAAAEAIETRNPDNSF